MTDTTGGVLPGVTVTAVNEASGNTFEGVTDERGVFRIALRTGAYRVTAQLQGFAVVTRSGLELLVGQQAVVNLQVSPSTSRPRSFRRTRAMRRFPAGRSGKARRE